MERPEVDNSTDAHVREAEDLLERRGILPENGIYTSRQLARELARRGWRWQIEIGNVKADKAYTSTGTVSQAIFSHKPDQVAALTLILARAIEHDEENGLDLMRPIQADLVVRSPDRRIIALVEVKSIQNLSDEEVRHFRRSILSRFREYSLVPYFLFVFRDFGYFWDQRTGMLPFSGTTRTFSMEPVIEHYLPWLRADEQPGEAEIGLAVTRWLGDLADRDPLTRYPESGGCSRLGG